MTTAPSCDHPMPQGDNRCQQCPQCAAGHCFAWAVPVIVSVLPAAPLHGQLIPALPAHAPGDLPARIYRPPRFSA